MQLNPEYELILGRIFMELSLVRAIYCLGGNQKVMFPERMFSNQISWMILLRWEHQWVGYIFITVLFIRNVVRRNLWALDRSKLRTFYHIMTYERKAERLPVFCNLLDDTRYKLSNRRFWYFWESPNVRCDKLDRTNSWVILTKV